MARPRRQAFTLIELLVVIAIIGVLVGLLLPAIQKVRETANKAACQSSMRQIGIALHLYHDSVGRFPLGIVNGTSPFTMYAGLRHTWPVWLYPYLEQDAAYKNFDPKVVNYNTSNSKGPPNPPVTSIVIHAFQCPSDSFGVTSQDYSGYAFLVPFSYGFISNSNYLGFFGDWDMGGARPDPGTHSPPWAHKNMKAAFGIDYGASLGEITDGTSNSMCIGEYVKGVPASRAPLNDTFDLRGQYWADEAGSSVIFTQFRPNTENKDILSSWCIHHPEINRPCKATGDSGWEETAASRSMHIGGVNVVFCDGSAHFINQNINPITWKALGSIASGDIVEDY